MSRFQVVKLSEGSGHYFNFSSHVWIFTRRFSSQEELLTAKVKHWNIEPEVGNWNTKSRPPRWGSPLVWAKVSCVAWQATPSLTNKDECRPNAIQVWGDGLGPAAAGRLPKEGETTVQMCIYSLIISNSRKSSGLITHLLWNHAIFGGFWHPKTTGCKTSW